MMNMNIRTLMRQRQRNPFDFDHIEFIKASRRGDLQSKPDRFSSISSHPCSDILNSPSGRERFR
jgi:hypothetical protein